MDDETAMLPELDKKREHENSEAERHRRNRDKLNEETKHWVDERDQLNAQVRALVEQANAHKAERDRFNDAVKEAKVQRDHWNREVGRLMEDISSLKKRKLPKNQIPLGKLKKELRDLEFKQMTSSLSPDKEKGLIEQISRLSKEIKGRENILQQDEEISGALKEVEKAKDLAEEHHRKVEEAADKAQEAHDRMMAAYEESDKVRKEADKAQERFIQTKVQADEEHKKHIEHIRQVHDYDKMISGIFRKKHKDKYKEAEAAARKDAESLMSKLQRGEKLSVEDLLALQKTGGYDEESEGEKKEE